MSRRSKRELERAVDGLEDQSAEDEGVTLVIRDYAAGDLDDVHDPDHDAAEPFNVTSVEIDMRQPDDWRTRSEGNG